MDHDSAGFVDFGAVVDAATGEDYSDSFHHFKSVSEVSENYMFVIFLRNPRFKLEIYSFGKKS